MKLECMDMIGLEFYRKRGGLNSRQIVDLSIRSFFTLNNTLNCEMNLYMHCTLRHYYFKSKHLTNYRFLSENGGLFKTNDKQEGGIWCLKCKTECQK